MCATLSSNTLSMNVRSFLTTLWFEMTMSDGEMWERKGVRPCRTPFLSHIKTLILCHFEGGQATEKPLFWL